MAETPALQKPQTKPEPEKSGENQTHESPTAPGIVQPPETKTADTAERSLQPEPEPTQIAPAKQPPGEPEPTAADVRPQPSPEVAPKTASDSARDNTPDKPRLETIGKTTDTAAPVASQPTLKPDSHASADAESATKDRPVETSAGSRIEKEASLPAKEQAAAMPPPAKRPVEPAAPKPTLAQDGTSTDSRLDQGLNWNQCVGPRAPLISRPAPAADQDTRIEADAADLYRNQNRAEFSGNVVVTQGNERLEAEQVTYARDENTLDADGRVFFEQPGLRVAGSKLHYRLDSRQGDAEQTEFRLTDSAARGTAATAKMLSPEQSHYSEVTYTSCPPENSDWMIRAKELEIDQSSGVGVARHANLSFKGVPFVYLPYISFPIDDRRKSGFLPPSIGSSESTGLDLSIPYYVNIAPQMDATITPRIMSKRGLMLAGEYRYLTPRSRGIAQAELLPNDSEQGEQENSTRGAIKIRTSGRPAPRWRYNVNINYVSDDDYIDDLGTSLAATSVRHQERRGDLRYQGNGWNLLGRVQYYQTIDPTIAVDSRPYSRLPQLLLNLEKPDQALGLTHHLRAEYVQFEHSADDKVTGRRLDLHPAISLPLRRPWGFLTPKLGVQHTQYDLDNQTTGLDSRPSRTLPTLSLDGGLYFDRSVDWFGSNATQTLEPRLFYLYTPHEGQSDIPNFDTTDRDFSFANLFRENRFNGIDKLGDANQLTAALTTRTLSNRSGRELLRASLGQIYYFRDREVQLNSGAAATDSSSAIVAEVAARLTENWRAQAGIQWNPHDGDGRTEKSAFGLHYLDQQQRIVNLNYRFTEGSIEQTDLSARWPINHRLHLVGRWNYSLLHEKSMESFAGLEYESCCWLTRVVLRDHRSDANSEGNLAILLQLELKGLTRLGERIDQFLERGILGYRTND